MIKKLNNCFNITFELIKKPFLPANRLATIKNIFAFLTILLVVLTSGYSATEFMFSTKATSIVYILLFVFSLGLLLFNLPIFKIERKHLFGRIKNKITFEIALSFVLLLLLFISCCATMFKGNNLNGAIRFLLVLFSCINIVVTVPFKKICKYFCVTVLFISIISPIFYIHQLILGPEGATDFFYTSAGSVVYSYGYLSFFLSGWNTYRTGLSTSTRMCGIFWEPSIYAAVLIVAMLLLKNAEIKNKIIIFILYLINLILTFSTGGFFLFFGVCLFYLVSAIKKRKIRIIVLISSLAAVALLSYLVLGPMLPKMIEWFPDIFSKFKTGISNSIRLKSFGYLAKVFAKSPIFGFGIFETKIEYIKYFPYKTGDFSITTTIGMLMAAFGIPGILFSIAIIVFPIFNKHNNYSANIIFVITFLLLINLENMIFISSIMLVAMASFKEGVVEYKCLSSVDNKVPRLPDKLFSSSEKGTTNKNMLGLLIIKGLSMLIGLFTIPVYNSFFVTNESYGIWSVILSVLSWTLLLDFGFGSGLRAKLSDVDENDSASKKSLISSTYIGSLASSLITFALFIALIFSLDLSSILNINPNTLDSSSLKTAMSILAFGLCLEFVIKNIVFIHYAEKKTPLGASYGLISNILIIVFFSLFKYQFDGSKMIAAAIIYALCANVPMIIGTLIYFFKKQNRSIVPSFKSFSWETCKSVMSFGLVFFMIQASHVVIAMTDSVFISSIFGPEAAGDYSKYYRIFGFVIGLMGSVVQQPIWSAIAASANKKKTKDIYKFIKLTVIIALVLFVLCTLFGLFLPTIFDLWLGDNTIPVSYGTVGIFIFYSFVYLVADAVIIAANALKRLKIQGIISALMACVKIGSVIGFSFVPEIASFGWPYIVFIDALCYVPIIIAIPFDLRSTIKKIGLETRVNYE